MNTSQKGQIEIVIVALIFFIALILTGGLSFLVPPDLSKLTTATPGKYIPCQKEVPEDQITSTLKNTYGVSLDGDTTPKKVKLVYDTICSLANYTYWQTYLKGSNITIHLLSGQCYDGHAQDDGNNLYEVNLGFCNNDYATIFTLIHELGHIIQFRNKNDIEDRFCNDVYNINNRSGCQSNYTLSSARLLHNVNCYCEYTDSHCGNPNDVQFNPSECFSDMVGFFFTYDKGVPYSLNSGPIGWQQMDSYPKNYPEYYNFAKQYLFKPVIGIYIIPTPAKGPTPNPLATPTPTDMPYAEDTATPTPKK